MKDLGIVTRADDAASFLSSNKAIEVCCKEGIIRNVSVMAVGPHLEDLVQRLKGIKNINIGLHFCLTAEWVQIKWRPVLPASEVSSLVDREGFFLPSSSLLHEHKFSIDHVLNEASAQLEKLREAGLEIKYIDEHMGIGWIFENDESDRLSRYLEDWSASEGLIYAEKIQQRLCVNHSEKVAGNPVRFLRCLETAENGLYVFISHPSLSDGELQTININGQLPGHAAVERTRDFNLCTDTNVISRFNQGDIKALRYEDALRLMDQESF